MENVSLTRSIQQDLDLDISPDKTMEEIRKVLTEHLSFLINNDFNQLVSLLYRIDISEQKLKTVLKENPGQDAAAMIAELVIERQLQKIRSRQQFGQRDNNIDEDERW